MYRIASSLLSKFSVRSFGYSLCNPPMLRIPSQIRLFSASPNLTSTTFKSNLKDLKQIVENEIEYEKSQSGDLFKDFTNGNLPKIVENFSKTSGFIFSHVPGSNQVIVTKETDDFSVKIIGSVDSVYTRSTEENENGVLPFLDVTVELTRKENSETVFVKVQLLNHDFEINEIYFTPNNSYGPLMEELDPEILDSFSTLLNSVSVNEDLYPPLYDYACSIEWMEYFDWLNQTKAFLAE